MRRRGLVVRLMAAIALAALAAGCGKKGDPETPLEEKVSYPRKYPK